MERKLSIFLIQHLLSSRFRSKKAMSIELALPYRTLLKVCAGKSDVQSALLVTSRILNYCIVNEIHLDVAVNKFH